MGQIHILSEEISGKIAAGEVVERPASVIKELVENSIDAGATSITVQIRDGGVSYMRVTDNGSGMTKEDARLCFIRHATSKISKPDDLDAIYTLGFRGEALASIAAVSKVDIYTKKSGENDGVHIKAEGGNIFEPESFGTPFGTNIIIQDLFFNTPARMKFLKKNSTEAGYIGDIMIKFILSHPEISFKFINGAKEIYFSSGNNKTEDCIYSVYGKDYAKNIIKMDYTIDNIHVSGAVGKSVLSRPNRSYQSFFINGRYVKSPLIARAVEEAYKNQIMIGKFPMAVVNIEINPSMIDINVHPTKLEVKFSNEHDIYSAVYFTVKNALYNTLDVPVISSVSENDVFSKDSTSRKNNIDEPVKSGNADIGNNSDVPKEQIYNSKNIMTDNKRDENLKQDGIVNNDNISAAKLAQEKIKRINVPADKNFNIHTVTSDEIESIDKTDNKNSGEKSIIDAFIANRDEYRNMKVKQNISVDLLDKKDEYKIIGQIFDTYIIIEKENEIFFFDQHAAHERIKYEQLKKSVENHSVLSQILLVPVIVSMTATEYAIYSENKECFINMGFESDDFGENCIAVRSSPVLLEESDLSSLVIELITYIGQSKKEIVSEKYDRMMYTIACKSAVKANYLMNEKEMKKLVDDVFAMDNINTCPHGRPIMISMSKKQVEKEFKRIV